MNFLLHNIVATNAGYSTLESYEKPRVRGHSFLLPGQLLYRCTWEWYYMYIQCNATLILCSPVFAGCLAVPWAGQVRHSPQDSAQPRETRCIHMLYMCTCCHGYAVACMYVLVPTSTCACICYVYYFGHMLVCCVICTNVNVEILMY